MVAILAGTPSLGTNICSRYLDKLALFAYLKQPSAVGRDYGIGP